MNILIDEIRILFDIDGIEFGGGERVFLQLASRLSDRFKVFFATMPGGRFTDEIEKSKITVFSVDMNRKYSMKPICQLREIILHQKIDIVHSQGARAEFYARLSNTLAGNSRYVSTIAMPVEGFDVNFLRKEVYYFFDRISEKFVDRFLVVSENLKNRLIKSRSIPPRKVIKINNGIEIDYFRPEKQNTYDHKIRQEYGCDDDVVLIGAIGRLVWQKGFEFLIRAIPKITIVAPESKFVFIGDGPLRGKLGALSEELKVKDNVIFAGFRNDIKEVLSAIDLLVVPSLLEGFPMVTLEAMAMEKPIVATRINGITEQITNGNHGILVPPKDHGALADAVLRLIQNKDLSKKFGVTARQRVEQDFPVEKMVAETEKVYLSLLNTKQ